MTTSPRHQPGPGPRTLIFRRIVEEICALTGSDAAASLIDGARLRLGSHVYSFIHDEHYHPAAMFVYVDLGHPPAGEAVLNDLMKMNFDLLAGTRGVISINPDTGKLFYAMRYQLGLASSGERLMSGVAQTLEDIGELMANGPWLPGMEDTLEPGKAEREIKPASLRANQPLN